jgi:bifunctional non-homologous end joining protein LigD
LKKVIAGTGFQFSESFEIDGGEMFAHACKLGLEGVVSKVRDGAYPSGRSNAWVNKTCAQRGTPRATHLPYINRITHSLQAAARAPS